MKRIVHLEILIAGDIKVYEMAMLIGILPKVEDVIVVKSQIVEDDATL